MLFQLRQFLTVLLLSTLLFVSSCATKAPSRFDQAQQESTQRGASAVVSESATGGQFNRFFPPSSDGYERVYSQEKKGFAEAKLKQDGKEVAVMAISDVLNNPSAMTKFKSSSQKIDGYPSVEQGKTGTAVLVGKRFQVKVLSRDPSFTQSDRQAWLEKFNLDGLAKLN
ncbi:hypothetical protein [Aphanothece sacrum]|uniref:Uncharacterized protein n=1 Tax=Aphanothece sacrum FPU1 TaxID=1920663 RepID=A0A401IJT0_APHSA|nr:hypothetical protein [Aphanothece sacrum]GBF81562.1 hypothetical protein AsFPU1_2976 [Aphanothece sacrum FPU1]GBF86981.1 hypothetical protein AsFPU3_4060 [Aphanothece sacrum FPU3]